MRRFLFRRPFGGVHYCVAALVPLRSYHATPVLANSTTGDDATASSTHTATAVNEGEQQQQQQQQQQQGSSRPESRRGAASTMLCGADVPLQCGVVVSRGRSSGILRALDTNREFTFFRRHIFRVPDELHTRRIRNILTEGREVHFFLRPRSGPRGWFGDAKDFSTACGLCVANESDTMHRWFNKQPYLVGTPNVRYDKNRKGHHEITDSATNLRFDCYPDELSASEKDLLNNSMRVRFTPSFDVDPSGSGLVRPVATKLEPCSQEELKDVTEVKQGRCIVWYEEKGWGFIKDPVSGMEYFVHADHILPPQASLMTSEQYFFTPEVVRGKLTASKVHRTTGTNWHREQAALRSGLRDTIRRVFRDAQQEAPEDGEVGRQASELAALRLSPEQHQRLEKYLCREVPNWVDAVYEGEEAEKSGPVFNDDVDRRAAQDAMQFFLDSSADKDGNDK